ncbi:MAG: GNAT family N-acetyltransferase [Pseudomonadota bacterium]
MHGNLTHRKATIVDLELIVSLLLEDELGQTRERMSQVLDNCYVDAFHKINIDSNQYLMIVEADLNIAAICHLTIMHSLTFMGSTRMQIEAVRVGEKYRNQGIGEWMMQRAIEWGKSKGASILQLTTNLKRHRARKFYERIGFEATHVGMKMHLKKNTEQEEGL